MIRFFRCPWDLSYRYCTISISLYYIMYASTCTNHAELYVPYSLHPGFPWLQWYMYDSHHLLKFQKTKSSTFSGKVCVFPMSCDFKGSGFARKFWNWYTTNVGTVVEIPFILCFFFLCAGPVQLTLSQAQRCCLLTPVLMAPGVAKWLERTLYNIEIMLTHYRSKHVKTLVCCLKMRYCTRYPNLDRW